MKIERLAPHDAPHYRALMLKAYALHPDAFTSTVEERAELPLAWWESRLQEGPQASQLVFGAYLEKQLAGVAGLSFGTRDKEKHKAKLFGMYVAAAARRTGLGRKLVQAVLDEARAREGVRIVQLTVTDTNQAAQILYERSGFTRFGLEPMAIAVGDGFAKKVHMWCDLERVQGEGS